MNLKCAIVDDEPLALSLMESYVNKTPFLTLEGKYSSAVQAMKELPDKQIDLLFLDIQMPELNGLEYSKMITPTTRIIFTTAFEQYALDGYKVNALDYLLKPISYVDFLQAANKAVQWFELSQQPKEEIQSIFVKSDYKLVQIELKKILYIEGLKDYIKIYEEDEDLLEDVIIEYRQAIEMVEMYSHILNGMLEIFASIISNNLNIVMRFLASITIILAVPTMLSSFWGMNVPVPLSDNPHGFFVVFIIAFCLAGGSAFWLWKKRMF